MLVALKSRANVIKGTSFIATGHFQLRAHQPVRIVNHWMANLVLLDLTVHTVSRLSVKAQV